MQLTWHSIDTVLLDLDGTLLDLHFDNHFWLEHVPKQLAQRQGISLAQSKKDLNKRYQTVNGQLQWYCLDYWAQQLSLNIIELKREIDHLISIRPYTLLFLHDVKKAGKTVILVTNAHRDSLSLKMECTQLQPYFDAIYSAHDFGLPKEDAHFWHLLSQHKTFNPDRTVFIDDNAAVLHSAKHYGIKHLIEISHPDSHGIKKTHSEYTLIDKLCELLPII